MAFLKYCVVGILKFVALLLIGIALAVAMLKHTWIGYSVLALMALVLTALAICNAHEAYKQKGPKP